MCTGVGCCEAPALPPWVPGEVGVRSCVPVCGTTACPCAPYHQHCPTLPLVSRAQRGCPAAGLSGCWQAHLLPARVGQEGTERTPGLLVRRSKAPCSSIRLPGSHLPR